MPRKKSNKNDLAPSQVRLFNFEPDDDTEGEETSCLSILIHMALLEELVRQYQAGDLDLNERNQVTFNARLYEADEDCSYFESGQGWAKGVTKEDWLDILDEWSEEAPEPKRKRTRSTGTSKKTRGNVRSRR